jgi:hypothetical protein
MAQSAPSNLARKALTITVLMFMSVMVGMVSAEVTNGDGTTGINRNDTNSEQDGASIDRTYTSLTGLTTDKIDLNNGMMMTKAGDITTGSNSYAMSTSTWVDGGLTDVGPVHYLAQGAGLDTTVDDLLLSITGGTQTFDAAMYPAISLPSNLAGNAAVASFTTTTTAITSVTVTTSGTGYTVGEVITLPIGAIHASQLAPVTITLAADDLLTPTRTNNMEVSATSIGGTGGGVNVVIQDASDGATGDSITMTLQNWYGASDRSTAHGLGTTVKAAGLATCAPSPGAAVQTCTLNDDTNGIDALLPTTFNMYPNEGGNTFSYGIGATDASKTFFFGADYATPHNVDVFINGVKTPAGDTKSVTVMDDIVLKCSDLSCTNSDIQIGVPSAYDSYQVVMAGGDPANEAAQPDVYNVTARLSVYDGKTVKLTFGTATEHQSNITATHGVFYDPSIRFLADEPGVRIGQIEDGGASWCDAWWFLAKCGDTLSFDGKASDGMDGVILHYKVPLESLYSQAAWGGYDKVQLRFSHSASQQCFNGNVQTYVLAPKDIGDFRTKNSFLKYATSGDYYTMTEPTSAHASGTTSIGTSATDYCFGSGSTPAVSETLVDIGRIGTMTSASPYSEYLNGFYDLDSQMYEFYVVVSVEQSSTPSSTTGITDEFSFDTGAETTTAGIAPGIILENIVARNPLQDFAPLEYRSTNSTNQSNPAFASPYVMFYSGITPSDNVVAGRNLTGSPEGVVEGGDFGHRYQGIQGQPLVRKPTDINIYANNYTDAGYKQTNTTPLSTIECGAAAFGGSMVSTTISIYTSLDTSLYYGAGANGSGYPVETTWTAYGSLTTNASRWLKGPASGFTNDYNVDNTESNTGTNIVSFTGSFINGDNYKATCTFVYYSDDIGAENVTTTTLSRDYFFTAAHDGNYTTTGGGSDVSDDDSSFLDDFDAYDYVIIGLALTLLGLAIYMWNSGSGISSWFDDRVAMMLLGVAILHAWVAQTYGAEGTGDLSSDTAMAIGTLGYLVMALAAYLWGNATSNQGERNFRFFLGGLFLIIIGVPTALTGILNVDSEFLVEAMWTFPVYEAIAGLGAFIGIILLGSSAAGLYRRGM